MVLAALVVLTTTTAVSPVAASNCPGGGHITVGSSGNTFCDFASAIADADPFDGLLVEPGVYAGGFTVDKPMIICSTPAGGTQCDATARDSTIIRGGGIYPIWIAADFVFLDGFTIENPDFATVDQDWGPVDPSLVVVDGDFATIENNVIQKIASDPLPGESRWFSVGVNIVDGATATRVISNVFRDLPASTGPDGTCLQQPCRTQAISKWGAGDDLLVRTNSFDLTGAGVSTAVSFRGANAEVERNTLVLAGAAPGSAATSVGIFATATVDNANIHENDLSIAPGETLGGAYGVFGHFRGSVVWENALRGMQHGIFFRYEATGGNYASRNTLTNNHEAIRIASSDTSALQNTIEQNVFGVVLDADQATGAVLRENAFAGNTRNLRLMDDVDGTHVDARENDWGVYTRTAIRAQIQDDGTGNTIDVDCFLDDDGVTRICPPTPDFTWAPFNPRPSDPVTLTDASTSGGRPINGWRWQFDDGSTASGDVVTREWPTSGLKSVTLTVTDEEGYQASVTKQVPVGNIAPVLEPVPPKTVAENDLLRFWVRATDPDGDRVSVAIANPPAGSSFLDYRNNTGLFTWRPSYTQSGSYLVNFIAGDGELNVVTTASITVTNVNRAPTASFTGPTVLALGQAGTWRSTSSDPDGPLATWTWLVDGVEKGWSDAYSASFPAAGSYTLALRVVDPSGVSGLATASVLVDATAPVTTPSFSGTLGTNGWYRSAVGVSLGATDAGGAGVSAIYYRIDGSTSRVYDAARPPSIATSGVHTVQFYAVDRVGNVEAVQTASVALDLEGPSLSLAEPTPLASGHVVVVGSAPLEVLADAADATSGVVGVELRVNGDVVDQASGAGPSFALEWAHAGAGPGDYEVRVVAFDAAGNSTTVTFRVLKAST